MNSLKPFLRIGELCFHWADTGLWYSVNKDGIKTTEFIAFTKMQQKQPDKRIVTIYRLTIFKLTIVL